MANQKSFFLRLYPFDKIEIDDSFIDKIVNGLKPIFFDNACFYFSPIDRSFLDICFHYKNWLNEFFNSKLITDNFHIWVRKADEGGWYDYISFASNRYEIDNEVILDKFGLEWSAINLKNIQYNSSCLYKADKLSIFGNSEKCKLFIQNILSGSFLRGFRKQNEIELDSKKKWSISLPIRYLASSFSEFDYEQNVGKMQNENIYESIEFQGHLSHVIIEDFSSTFNTEMKGLIFNKSNNNDYNSVGSVEMDSNGKIVYRFEQNLKTGIKKQTSWNSWANCIDEEFIKFLIWYNK